jgi:hypothetical protein
VFGSDLKMCLRDEVLEEHLGRNCDYESGIGGAVAIVWVGVDDLLDSSDWGGSSVRCSCGMAGSIYAEARLRL